MASRLTPRAVQRRFIDGMVSRREASGPELWAREQMRRHDLTAVLEASRAVGQFSSTKWIGSIDVPTAVVVTTRDTLVVRTRQLALASAIEGATVHQVDADHDAAVFAPTASCPRCSTPANRWRRGHWCVADRGRQPYRLHGAAVEVIDES